ncbi:MAG TPA: Holliday junction resolvase RuvX [Solirubrobacteraceae bacterium]|nr:Holliday junction resolvase RuvX [Solirubrobacteraceae bacterium]
MLALDYGSARCGVAVSDPTGVLATPLDPVLKPAGRSGMGRILALVRELEVERVIVGLPLSLAGGDSLQTREARTFAAVLAKRLGATPVELYDERFTTVLAQRDAEIGSRPPRASEDSRAAAHLLASWLDRHGHT